MKQRKYFGTDGVRGLVGTAPINPEFAMKLGWAAGRVLSKGGTKKVFWHRWRTWFSGNSANQP